MYTPTPEDELWLDEALREFSVSRDPALREAIVEKTNWIAIRSARRFSDRGEPFDDLLQVARIGLLKVIERFDPIHGV